MSRFLRAYFTSFSRLQNGGSFHDSSTPDRKQIRKIISSLITLLTEGSALAIWQEEGEKTARSYRLSVV
jgi:hypothetical protein